LNAGTDGVIDNLFVASTYKNILEHVARPVLDGAAGILLNEPVVAIEASPRIPNAKHAVTVKTATGNQYVFDEVVTTTPLGWLKQNKSAFNPPLPPRLSQAIDSISYGKLEKVCVSFPSAFWQDTTIAPHAASSNPDGSRNAAFFQFMTPNYVDHPPTPHWNQECITLSALPAPHASPTLLFYLYPPCSTHLTTTLASLPRDSPEYTATLTRFFQPYYSRLPNYSPADPACHPQSFLATSWQTDPYAGNGSYSNSSSGWRKVTAISRLCERGWGSSAACGLPVNIRRNSSLWEPRWAHIGVVMRWRGGCVGFFLGRDRRKQWRRRGD
jgi:hypothetical protein